MDFRLNKESIIAGFKGGRGKGFKKDGKDRLRINRDIVAPEIRVIGEDGKMLGVMAPDAAVRLAEDAGLDLIEIAPTAKPPTCRIMDYGKWRYEAQKKEREAKKKQTVITIKEIQMRPRTEDHDLEVKLKHARKFLLGGDKVKVNLRFTGREMAHQDLGVKMLKEVGKRLEEIANIEAPPKKEGRQVFILMAPDAVKIKEYQAKKDRKDEDLPTADSLAEEAAADAKADAEKKADKKAAEAPSEA